MFFYSNNIQEVKVKAILFFAVVYFLNGVMMAQNLGSVRGKVIDERTNSPLTNANVIILGKSLGSSTDSSGEYFIHNVPEGLFEIKVSYLGYKTFQKSDIRVVRNKATQVPEIKLTESSVADSGLTVTAGVFQDNSDMPVSTFSFTKDEIRRSPGAAGDIFRAMGTLPGVATEGGEISAFSVRGSGPKDNLILVDNIPFTKVSHFDGGGIEGEESQGGRFGVFAPSLIEKADFSAGGFPARYGGKNSSIINMDIKEGNLNNMTVYGHYDLFGWEANYDGPLPISDKSGLIVSARRVDFETILNMIGEKGHGTPDYTDVLVKSTTEINTSHKISLLGIYSDDNMIRTIDNIFDSKDINRNQLMNHSDYRYMIGANDRALLGALGFIQTTAYYYTNKVTSTEGRANTASDFGMTPTKDNSYVRDNIYNRTVDEHTFGIKSDMTLSLNSNTSLFAGIESKHNEYHYTMFMNGIDTLYVFNKSDSRSDPTKDYIIISPQRYNQDNNFNSNYYAGYAEASLKLSSQFTMNPGLRYEHYVYNNENYLSPRLSMRYQLTPKISFNVSSGVYYQLPELGTLAMDNSNGNLKNERAMHFIVGTSAYLSNDLKLTMESYYKKFDNLLVRTNRYDEQYSNDGTGWAGGFDISLVKRFSDNYYGQTSYSYTTSKRNDNKGEGEYDYAFSKPHMFKILGGYQFNEEWSMTAKWTITSGLPTDDYIIHADVLNNPNVMRYSEEIVKRNGHRFALNQSFDVRVDYRKQFKFVALSLYIDIWNLFGTKNVTGEQFIPQNGDFSNEGMGTVPSFGFSLEF
jgi:outer membrane receptor for ferrienterochelin and colicin